MSTMIFAGVVIFAWAKSPAWVTPRCYYDLRPPNSPPRHPGRVEERRCPKSIL